MPGFRIWISVILPWLLSTDVGGSGPTLDYQLRIDRDPALGAVAEAEAGEPLYLEQSLPELPTAKLAGEAVVTAAGERWLVGKVLYAARIDAQQWFCDPLRTRPRWDAGLIVPRAGATRAGGRHLCARDEDRDGAFDRLDAAGYELPEPFASVAYELGGREPVAPFAAKAFRRQLVFVGCGGGRLRVGYSEGVEAAGGPVSYRELDLEIEELPGRLPEVGFGEVRIQVLELPGERDRRLRYRVTRGFGGSGEETGRDSGGVR